MAPGAQCIKSLIALSKICLKTQSLSLAAVPQSSLVSFLMVISRDLRPACKHKHLQCHDLFSVWGGFIWLLRGEPSRGGKRQYDKHRAWFCWIQTWAIPQRFGQIRGLMIKQHLKHPKDCKQKWLTPEIDSQKTLEWTLNRSSSRCWTGPLNPQWASDSLVQRENAPPSSS